MIQPIWETWSRRLPTHPLCCDMFADGVFRRSREAALKRQHLQFNNDAFVNCLVIDIDRPDSFEAWDRANLHAPNLYVQNPANGHGHLFYWLAQPVGTYVSHRPAPIELAAAVQRGTTRRLGGDPTYANRLAKNPLHGRWRSSWLVGKPFDLTTLLEPLDHHDTRPYARRSEIAGISRNCDLFDELRYFAYRKVVAFKEMSNLNAWRLRLLDEACGINLGFATPLPISALRTIAKSVAKWSWRKFSREEFSAIQAERARRGRFLDRQATSAAIAAAIDELGATVGMEAIAHRIGKSTRTVRRYAAEPRGHYEGRSIRHSKPWLAQRTSRATWYRHRALRQVGHEPYQDNP